MSFAKAQMKFSVVVSTHAAGFKAATLQGDLEGNLSRLAAIGYDGAELAIRDPALVDGQALLDAVRREGLEVAAIGTGQAWGEDGLSFTALDEKTRRTAVDRIKSHLPFAAAADAPVIIGLIRGRSGPGVNKDMAGALLIEALVECAAGAEQAGVRLALEPINSEETDLVNDVEQGLELLEQVDSPALGLLADTYHMHREEKDIISALEQYKGRLFHVHVADSNRRYPGAGELDFAAILDILEGMGYSGFVSGEFLPWPNAGDAARRSLEHLKGITGGRR